ncbi:kinase-like domain-containing protein [Panaeolus papilionaceus]|nr:kinase-like domain-containing protein [Panaeolus papilionaceus]
MAAFASRAAATAAQNASPSSNVPNGGLSVEAATAALARASLDSPSPSQPQPMNRPPLKMPGQSGMAARRQRNPLSLRDIDSGLLFDGPAAAGLGAGRPIALPPRKPPPSFNSTPFSNFSKIVDPSGALNFNGKAVLHASGVNFENGASFTISMDQLQLDEELGKGNYGTVKKVLHKPTNVLMAMKEIRLELEDAKINAIIMELDVLHRAVAPEIVDFYGAFFIESCVYYCMEYMDAGSLDKLHGVGVPEDVLARIASSMVKGLKFLKDELNIIHRDVKPTNVLINQKGEIKLCDFGISGELDKSLAKTNIGCQSYMAPERIKGESQNNLGTYTVSSDVWSLGLSMIEIGLGRYPYPPETYSNVFAQLTAIVHGDPPELPEGRYSESAREWVSLCMRKEPTRRAKYAELLAHPFLVNEHLSSVNMVAWVRKALEYKLKVTAATKAAHMAQLGPPASSVSIGAVA